MNETKTKGWQSMTDQPKERTPTNECYSCKHRRAIYGDCHSRCIRPDKDMTGSEHGIEKGWFAYPWNFDPIWKTKLCANYEMRENASAGHA